MRLNIYSSNTTNGAISSCIGAIKGLPATENAIVIVPDRFSLSVEQDIYERLGISGSFNIDVVSFSRFAVKVNRNEKTFLSKEGTVMLLKKVMTSLQDKLVFFKNKISAGFSRELFAAIASLRSSGISPSDLISASVGFPPSQKAKFLDIALIYDAYERELSENYTDTVSRINSLISALETNEWVARSRIYVVGFNIFSKQQKSLISALLRFALEVNVSCVYSAENPKMYSFSERNALMLLAENIGASAKEYFFADKLNAPFDVLHRLMFSFFNGETRLDTNGKIRLLKSPKPYDEVKELCREIVYQIKKGKRFLDIAVVCCDDSYKRLIKELFPRFHIPFFLDDKYPAVSSTLYRFISLLFELNISAFKRETVFQLIKHPYLNVKREAAEAFENYCLKYNIDRSRFLKPFALGDFSASEEVRKRLDDPLFIIKGDGLEECISCLKKALEAYFVPGEDSVDPLKIAGNQCEEKLFTLLDETVSILGSEKSNIEDIYSVIASGAANLEVSLIPQKLDCVFIGNTAESRYSGIKSLFIIGANDGFFPYKTGEQLIVTNADLYFLEREGLSVQPTPLENNRLEQFVIADLMCRAEELFVSYSVLSEGGEGRLSGEGVKELEYIFGIGGMPSYRKLSGQEELLYRLGSVENAYIEYISGEVPTEYRYCVEQYLEYRGFDLTKTEKIFRPLESGGAPFASFFKEKERLFTKVTQLEKYFSCPYAHYLSYGLGLRTKETSSLRVADVGTVIHKILELFFQETLHKVKELDEDEIITTAKRCIEKVLSDERLAALAETPSQRHMLQNIRTESVKIIRALAKNVKNSLFEPEFIEMTFGMDGEYPPITIETEYGTVYVKGKVDRVDICGKKALVIDYKTGKADAPDDWPYVYYGKKIQPYVYMQALIDMGYTPAGAVYLPLPDSYNAKGVSYKFKGRIERSMETVCQLDTAFAAEQKENGCAKSLLFDAQSYKKPKDKSDPFGAKNASLIVRADFYNLCTYVKRLTALAVEEIMRGNISMSPLHTGDMDGPCKYCDYKTMCPEEEISVRTAEKLSLSDIVSTLGQDAADAIEIKKLRGDEYEEKTKQKDL